MTGGGGLVAVAQSTTEWYGWKKDDESEWQPVMSTLPPAPDVVLRLVKCGCQKTRCATKHCACAKANLPCTDMCRCMDTDELCANTAAQQERRQWRRRGRRKWWMWRWWGQWRHIFWLALSMWHFSFDMLMLWVYFGCYLFTSVSVIVIKNDAAKCLGRNILVWLSNCHCSCPTHFPECQQPFLETRDFISWHMPPDYLMRL